MNDEFSLEILYTDPNIHNELFQLVENRACSQLDARLQQLSNPNHYLTILKRYDQEQVSLLMLAASCGYDDVIRLLLTHDNTPDHVEVKGRIILSNGSSIDGATALYCACYNEHFTVAQTLIELGHADVNQDTHDYRFYPLLLNATINNRRDIVAFLLENNYADVNETRSYDADQSTALIWAAFRGYTSLIEYLISKGADINYTCKNQNLITSTPFGCAVLAGHLGAVRLLYHAGAYVNIIDNHGDNPLTIAVKKHYPFIIDFLLNEFISTFEDLELAACNLIKSNSSLEEMQYLLSILKMALERRELSNIPKIGVERIAAYDYHQECQTTDELDSIRDDRNRMYIETLLIRERIALSRNDISIVKPLHYYGDMLVANEQFEKCLNVWIHMFYLYQKMNMTTILHRFVWLFCQMLTVDQRIPAEWFLRVGRLVFEPSHLEETNFNVLNVFFLLIIATKVLKQKELSQTDRSSIYSWVTNLCRHRWTTKDGRALLHLCVDTQLDGLLTFRPMDTRRHLRLRDESTLRLLLICGSRWLDLDVIEPSYGETPLHLVCQQPNSRRILELLLQSGCHIDCVNKYGITPLTFIEDPETRQLFPSERMPSNLKCLCARLIAKQRLNISQLGSSTSALNKFIVLHGYHTE